MVAIEEVQDEEEEEEQQKGIEDNDNDTNKSDNDNVEEEEEDDDDDDDDDDDEVPVKLNEWQKLMGKDLMLKVTEMDDDTDNPLIKAMKEKEGKQSSKKKRKKVQRVEPQDTVLVDIVGRLAKDINDTNDINDEKNPIFQQAKGWLLVVGEGDVIPALEMGIRFMAAGQTATIWSNSKFAFGLDTRSYKATPDAKETIVPPNANIMFQVKVIQIVMDTSRLNPYFTIQKALTRKKIANDIYQHEWTKDQVGSALTNNMQRALKLYQKAGDDMNNLLQGTYFNQVEQDHPQRIQAKQVMLDCYNNIVALQLRAKQYNKAKQAAIQVLQKDSKNLKGLLRAAKASLHDPASTFEEVQAAIKAAENEITYKTPKEEEELKQLKVLFKRNQQNYKKQTKQMFANKLNTATTEKATKTEPQQKETTETTNEETNNDNNESPPASNTSKSIIDMQQEADTDTGATNKQRPPQNFWQDEKIRPYLIQLGIFLFLLTIYLVTKPNPETINTITSEAKNNDIGKDHEEF